MTRLNVYAGLTGFYFIRDSMDKGKHDNPLQLPAEQYEHAYCIQDRMFKENGDLFYPAFDGDPAWDAHPIHVHLVHFEILRRNSFTANLINQDVITHDGGIGKGFRLENIVVGAKGKVLNTE